MSFLKKNLIYPMKKVGTNPTRLAKDVGVSQPTIHRIVKGDADDPKVSTLIDLADHLGTTVDDLCNRDLTGENIGGYVGHTSVVPLISWVQAGDWQEVIDNLHPGEGERIPTVYKAREHTYALRVHGDSMEPKFSSGDIIIVEPEEQPENGSFVVVRQNSDEATFKQLCMDGSDWFLKPLNPRYPIMEMKPDAVICGVVKWKQSEV